MADQIEMRYFSSVKGRAVPRHGSDAFIGCRKVKGKGFEWDTDKVVAVPLSDFQRYGRDYSNNLRRGDLEERSKKDYDADQERIEKEVTAAAEKLRGKKKRGGKKPPSSSDEGRNEEEG